MCQIRFLHVRVQLFSFARHIWYGQYYNVLGNSV